MSYAGTYGSDETCEHDYYWRSCGICGPTGVRAQERAAARKAEEDRKAKDKK